MSGPSGGFMTRVRSLPGLLAKAPAWTVLVAGVVLTGLGLLILTRPLTSLVVLGIYIGISCVISGVADLLARPKDAPWWDTASAVLWTVAGVAILVWLGRSIELLPVALAILLVVSGVARLGGVLRGPWSVRALNGSFGIAEIAFGLLALGWPDVTIIIVAILFGIRTILFGLSLIWRGLRHYLLGRTSDADPGRGQPRTGALFDVARWIGAAVVLIVTVGALWVSATLHGGAPVIDTFYFTPGDVPDQPGQLLRAEPYTADVPDGISAWRILYTTTKQDGVPAIATGVVGVPTAAAAAPVPVIAWDHGTVGIGRGCAPSIRPGAVASPQIPAMDAVVRNGWAVVATDYSGMGAEGDTPYLVGDAQARSALDAVRAAHQLPGVSLSDETVVWGHSQGGHAALWTSQLAPSYAPELQILGTAALSPASDPQAIAKDIYARAKAGPGVIAMAWLVWSYTLYYPDVKLDDYVAPAARSIVREMAQRCPDEPGLLASVLSSIAVAEDTQIFDLDLDSGPLAARLVENVPRGPWAQPLFIGWGSEDEVIAPAIQDAYVASLCVAGQALESKVYDGLSHFGVVDLGSPLYADLEQWTRDRIARLPGTSTCG